MKNIVLLSILLLCGCGEYPQYPNSKTTKFSAIDEIKTVEHDGHEFVIWDGYRNGTMIHHPSCHCLKESEEFK
jgi:hypothetical protein